MKGCRVIIIAPAIYHDDVIKWKHFPRYWPFVRGIYRSPVNSPHKGQWHRALIFTLICVWINGCVNNREAGDLRRYCAHYGVTVMHIFHDRLYSLMILSSPPLICNVLTSVHWDTALMNLGKKNGRYIEDYIFIYIFLNGTSVYSNFRDFCHWRSNWQYVSLGSWAALVPITWHATSCTKVD